MYRVLIHSPDQHIRYDGSVPDLVGVGGGVTARIRLAAALRRLGHEVTMHVNCGDREEHDGVVYVPLGASPPPDADILVMNTTGGELDLTPSADLGLTARLTIAWVGGTAAPRGMSRAGFDYVYSPSNFIRDVAVEDWGVPAAAVFVAYNAVEEELFRDVSASEADRGAHDLVYLSHPSKGLDTAVDVLRRLRERDDRYRLQVFGGSRLWGEEDSSVSRDEGVLYHGLVGQRQLTERLHHCAFAIHLQDTPEAFGISLAESMRAGCISLASPVGAFPELISHAYDGLLLPGDHRDSSVRERATAIILTLGRNADFSSYLRSNAKAFPWTWDRMARVWTGHWDWALRDRDSAGVQPPALACPSCGDGLLHLADGHHCTKCGRYFRSLTAQ